MRMSAAIGKNAITAPKMGRAGEVFHMLGNIAAPSEKYNKSHISAKLYADKLNFEWSMLLNLSFIVN